MNNPSQQAAKADAALKACRHAVLRSSIWHANFIARSRTCNCIIAYVQLHKGERAMNATACVGLRPVLSELKK